MPKKATKTATKKAITAPPRDRMIRFTVGNQPIGEGSRIYQPGETAELPETRVKAFGSLVRRAD